jgi:hypothetical protein
MYKIWMYHETTRGRTINKRLNQDETDARHTWRDEQQEYERVIHTDGKGTWEEEERKRKEEGKRWERSEESENDQAWGLPPLILLSGVGDGSLFSKNDSSAVMTVRGSVEMILVMTLGTRSLARVGAGFSPMKMGVFSGGRPIRASREFLRECM